MEEKLLLEGNEQEITTRFLLPENPLCMYVFAHGAGAGIDHDFIKNVQNSLFKKGIATFTFNFIYKEKGKKLPSSKKAVDREYKLLWEYVRSEYGNKLPLFAGGKSMGGRVSTRVIDDLTGVKGLIFLGFPIHSPGRPDKLVGAYIKNIQTPMLFLQGSRDPFSSKDVAEKVVAELQHAHLYWLDGGKHSWETTKKNPKNQTQLINEACDQIVLFCKNILNYL